MITPGGVVVCMQLKYVVVLAGFEWCDASYSRDDANSRLSPPPLSRSSEPSRRKCKNKKDILNCVIFSEVQVSNFITSRIHTCTK